MNSFEILPYHYALRIYLEIYDHPKIINAYIARGLTENEANTLATKVSLSISDYESVVGKYKTELFGGLILAVLSFLVALYLHLSFNKNQEIKRISRQILLLAFTGIGIFIKGLRDQKIVLQYQNALKKCGLI
jgi:hypothetical protein